MVENNFPCLLTFESFSSDTDDVTAAPNALQFTFRLNYSVYMSSLSQASLTNSGHFTWNFLGINLLRDFWGAWPTILYFIYYVRKNIFWIRMWLGYRNKQFWRKYLYKQPLNFRAFPNSGVNLNYKFINRYIQNQHVWGTQWSNRLFTLRFA